MYVSSTPDLHLFWIACYPHCQRWPRSKSCRLLTIEIHKLAEKPALEVPEMNRKVEQASIRAVKRWYRSRGWRVDDHRRKTMDMT